VLDIAVRDFVEIRSVAYVLWSTARDGSRAGKNL